ncbi:ROK family protein [Ktedonosporobacter rubrisoli]|uniref:ROK family protein n=1 Tax=Ktedonosporobacter rubrisoli TaxID=2509675 RepID=A0A4V0Z057_KTERU|nr:ROK family protein [Ktedonosporobacter rubrisoli]QBD82061.1 ROK family protein [Ktedonosporobacter rubrisoli]
MSIEASEQFVVGIDVGGTGLKGAVVTLQGHVHLQEHRPTHRERGPKAVIESILNFASDLIKQAGNEHVAAAGVAIPGLVDEEAGIALKSVNLGWQDVPLHKLLEEHLGLPVAIGHDVRTAGFAEGLLGAARGSENYLFLTLGTGIGAVMVLRGATYVGVNGVGGEFGHIMLRPHDGPLCACGARGCIEALASASAVAQRYRTLAQITEEIGARDVAELANAGNSIARQVWDDAIEALGLGLANYVTLLDPERVVIGGGMADAGQMLFEPLKEQLSKFVRFQPVPALLAAQLGNNAGYLGATLKAWVAAGIPQTELSWSQEAFSTAEL